MISSEAISDADYPTLVQRFYAEQDIFEELLVEAFANEPSATMPCLQTYLALIASRRKNRVIDKTLDHAERMLGHLVFHLINNFVEAESGRAGR